jgi:hypothetical protein
VKNDRAHNRWPREPVNQGRFAKKPSEGRSDFLSNLRKVTEKPPTGFSELDVGEFIRSTSPSQSDDRLFGGPPGVECDVGRMLDELVSSELEPTQLETTKLTTHIVRDGCCLTMNSTRFQLCQN